MAVLSKAAGADEDRRLPVTVLSGFLGSGKTTVLREILTNTQGLRVALIVNDMAALNIDAMEIAKHVDEPAPGDRNKTRGAGRRGSRKKKEEEKAAAATKPKMVALQNGCICCTLREDLIEQVAELASGPEKYDYLVIESTGISEPVPVAQTFCHSLKELEAMAHSGHFHSHGADAEEEEADAEQEEAEQPAAEAALQPMAGVGHFHAHEADAEQDQAEQPAAAAAEKQDVLADKLHLMSKESELSEEEEEVPAANGNPASSTAENEKRLAMQALELRKLARLDTMVTVVDGAQIFNVLQSVDDLRNSKWSQAEAAHADDQEIDMDRTITDLLMDQIEFADVVVLNKRDLVRSEYIAQTCEGLIRKLNPGAEVLWTSYGRVPVEKLLGTGRFDFEKASGSAGWIRELMHGGVVESKEGGARGGHKPETEEYGISSVVFRARRPFVPQKLAEILSGFGTLTELAQASRAAAGRPIEASTSSPPKMNTEISASSVGSTAANSSPAGKSSSSGSKSSSSDESSSSLDESSSSDDSSSSESESSDEDSKQMLKAAAKRMDPNGVFNGVIRSKGQVWLANVATLRITWQSVGRQFSLLPAEPLVSAMLEAGYGVDFNDLHAHQHSHDEGCLAHGHADGSSSDDDDPADHEPQHAAAATECAGTAVQTPANTDKGCSDASSETFEAEYERCWGSDRETELVLIGVHLDKQRILDALTDALVPEEEMALATQDKLRYEKFIKETRRERGREACAALTREEVMKGTGGLKTPWDRLLQYEDPFFGGKFGCL